LPSSSGLSPHFEFKCVAGQGRKVTVLSNTPFHTVHTKPLKATEHIVSSTGYRWEKNSHSNKFTEVECVVTHGARMCDPEGVCVGELIPYVV